MASVGQSDGFQDCIQLNRITINAKDDSFSMAKERMVQQEYEQKKSATKQLSAPKNSQAKISIKPRNMSLNDGSSRTSKHSVDLDSSNSESLQGNPLVASKSLRLTRDGLTREQKEKLYKVIKEVAQINRNDAYSLLPELISRIDPEWPGYSKVERLQLANIKNKHKGDSVEKSSSERKVSLSLQKKINVLDQLKQKPEQAQLIAFQNSISMDTLNQWCAKESELRERYDSCMNKSQVKSNCSAHVSSGSYSSPKKARISMRPSESKLDNPTSEDSGSMRVSTAPRLPGSRSRSSATAQNNPFLLDLAMEQQPAPQTLPNNASSSVTKSNQESGCSHVTSDFSSRKLNGSSSSSSGCSSMSSSVIPSPVEQDNKSSSSTYVQQSHFNSNHSRSMHRTSRNHYGQSCTGSGGESSEHTPCSGSSLVSGFSNRSADSPSSVLLNRSSSTSNNNRVNSHNNGFSNSHNITSLHQSNLTQSELHTSSRSQKTFRNDEQNSKKHSVTAASGRWNTARCSETNNSSTSQSFKMDTTEESNHDLSSRTLVCSKNKTNGSGGLLESAQDNMDIGDSSSVEMDISDDETEPIRQQNQIPLNEPVDSNAEDLCINSVTDENLINEAQLLHRGGSLHSTESSTSAFHKSMNKCLYSNNGNQKLSNHKADKMRQSQMNRCANVLDNISDELASEVAELDQIYPALLTSSAARNYRLEFDSVYPVYLKTHNRSTKRWTQIRRLYNQLQHMNSSNNSSDDIAKLSSELQKLTDEAMSSACQVEELQLSVMDYKLKLLKSRLAEFYGPRLKNCDNYTLKVNSKRSNIERLGAALS